VIDTCGAVTSEEIVSYWASDLPAADTDRLDEHFMNCSACAEASARIAVLAEGMRTIIPPVVDHAALEALRARGYRIRENPLTPGERKPAVFEAETDLLIHKLAGLDLTEATNVGLRLTVEETGDVLLDDPSVPFDRDSGELLLACQRHFASLPPNIVVYVRVRGASGSESATHYPIPHIFEPQPGA
jgi:hypothetical protein